MIKIKQMNYDVEAVATAICNLGKQFCNAFNLIFENLNNKLNGKITKKRFIKLLQSKGIQRNTINEIIKNNKEEYTYARYLNTVENLEGRSTYDR